MAIYLIKIDDKTLRAIAADWSEPKHAIAHLIYKEIRDKLGKEMTEKYSVMEIVEPKEL